MEMSRDSLDFEHLGSREATELVGVSATITVAVDGELIGDRARKGSVTGREMVVPVRRMNQEEEVAAYIPKDSGWHH
jgi:hypothetical protein